MGRKIIFLAGILGALGVVLGALGAHALKAVLTEAQLTTFEVGVRYQIYHAMFLLFVGSTSFLTDKTKKMVAFLIAIGVLFFSGSIYLLSTNGLTSVDFKFLGPITPIGGVFLISGWIVVAVKAFLSKKTN